MDNLKKYMESSLKETELSEYLLSIPGANVVSMVSCLGTLRNPFWIIIWRPEKLKRLKGISIGSNKKENPGSDYLYCRRRKSIKIRRKSSAELEKVKWKWLNRLQDTDNKA